MKFCVVSTNEEGSTNVIGPFDGESLAQDCADKLSKDGCETEVYPLCPW